MIPTNMIVSDLDGTLSRIDNVAKWQEEHVL